jgi:PBP1b-binding outer membrane lipoprotein LpoB
MKRLLSAALLALSLTGCAGLDVATIADVNRTEAFIYELVQPTMAALTTIAT